MKRIRALHFQVQPVLVVDDGEHLAQLAIDPIVISGADWPSYARDVWPNALAELEEQVNAADATTEAPAANRAQRRAAAKRKPSGGAA